MIKRSAGDLWKWDSHRAVQAVARQLLFWGSVFVKDFPIRQAAFIFLVLMFPAAHPEPAWLGLPRHKAIRGASQELQGWCPSFHTDQPKAFEVTTAL